MAKEKLTYLPIIVVLITAMLGEFIVPSFRLSPNLPQREKTPPAGQPLPASTLTLPDPNPPAPLGGPVPGVTLGAAHGAPGASLHVSGTVPSNLYPGVRIAWLIADTTYTAAVVTTTNLNYQADIRVPLTPSPGPAQVCATLTSLATAAFACQPFVLDAPAPGSVSGVLPAAPAAASAGPGEKASPANRPAAISAAFSLVDRAGSTLYSTPVAGDGSFSLSEVSPGTYRYVITGTVSALTAPGYVSVSPGKTSAPVFGGGSLMFDPVTGSLCLPGSSASVSAVAASPSDHNFLLPTPYSPTGLALDLSISSLLAFDHDFGVYLQGVSLPVTFKSDLQLTSSTPVSKVQYHIQRPDHIIVPVGESTLSSSHYSVTFDVGTLPVQGTYKLIAAPFEGSARQCPSIYTIKVIGDPMTSSELQHPGSATTWNAVSGRYDFTGVIPNLGGILPIIYPSPPPTLPLLGKAENSLDAGIFVNGSIKLNGVITFSLFQAKAYARLFNQEVYSKSFDILSSGIDRSSIDPRDLTKTYLGYGPIKLWSDSITTKVFEGPLASFWGVVTVKASVSVGLDGQITVKGTLYPFQPNLDSTLTPRISPSLTLSVWIELLLGVASAGADAKTTLGISLPLRIDTTRTAPDPKAWIDTPCFSIKITLSAWARVNLYFVKKTWNLASYDVLNYATPAGCSALARAILIEDPQAVLAPPRVIANPVMASSPDGRMLAAYIDDATPATITATIQVMARTWNGALGQWSAPIALSDGSHAVQDPTAAFAGPDSTPMVAWTETVITPAADLAAGDNLNAFLQRQEIVYALWNSATNSWGPPLRLTDDNLPDGRPSLAGDAGGASLAWVVNPGGMVTTTRQMRIAVSDWTAGAGWSPPSLLNANLQGDAMNVQPSVARLSGGQGAVRAIAWTVDPDGDPNTAADRHIVVKRWSLNTGWTGPAFDDTSSLPPGAEAPSLSADPASGRLNLAFLVHGQDADGADTGFGNQNMLWTAAADTNGLWSAAALLDGAAPVRAEHPQLKTSAAGEKLLLFRRFGAAGTNAYLGQLALSLGGAGGAFSSPLYLTDDLSQHWQAALEIDPATQAARLLNVKRPTLLASGAPPASAGLRPAANLHIVSTPAITLTTSADPVETFSVPASADLALEPGLLVSAQHALPGAAVVVTATLHNLGLAPAVSEPQIPVQVCFYTGAPPNGSQQGCQALQANDILNFAGQRQFQFSYQSAGGDQPVYARVFSHNYNGPAANDIAAGNLGSIPAPVLTSVSPDPQFDKALGAAWLPPAVPGVAGFRLLRSTLSGGPYELAGETSNTYQPDLLLTRLQLYCYVVQAYDATGLLSPASNEICAQLPPVTVFLPLVQRK